MSVVDMLMEDANFRAEYEAHLLAAYELLLHGRQGFGKGMSSKGKMGVGTLQAEPPTKLPQKICNYRRPKLYWYGEMHGSNNFIHNPGYTMVPHWDVTATALTVKGRNPDEGLSVWPATPMGSTTGRNALSGNRFVGISEPDTDFNAVDQDFLKKLTGEEWVETKTYDKKSATWKPLGEVFVMSGKPLKINERDKEIIERVKRIEFPEA